MSLQNDVRYENVTVLPLFLPLIQSASETNETKKKHIAKLTISYLATDFDTLLGDLKTVQRAHKHTDYPKTESDRVVSKVHFILKLKNSSCSKLIY